MKRARLVLTAFALALVSSEAQAQLMGNAPYRPSFGAIGIATGMSPAYRQAILNAKLFGRQSNPLVRGRDGSLLEVERRGSQAFLREQASPFVVTSSGATAGVSVAGGGLGFGFGRPTDADPATYAADLYGVAGYGNRLSWIAMLGEPEGAWPWSGVTAAATTAAPINIWIAQLE